MSGNPNGKFGAETENAIQKYCKENNVDIETILHKGWEYGVYWQDGRPFHGPYSIRINLALPLSRVKEAFDRLKTYVF